MRCTVLIKGHVCELRTHLRGQRGGGSLRVFTFIRWFEHGLIGTWPIKNLPQELRTKNSRKPVPG